MKVLTFLMGKASLPVLLAAVVVSGFAYIAKLRSDVSEARASRDFAEGQLIAASRAVEQMSRQAEALVESERAATKELQERLRRIGRAHDACLDETLPAELLD